MNDVYIGLGANIGDRKGYIDDAINLLVNNNEVKLQSKSSIYETAPVGYEDQDHFLNMVIHISTPLTQWEILKKCQVIENELGRERQIKNGPRTIDLDILLYNNESSQFDRLTIPHPRLHERAFVLVPLTEIAPQVIVPTFGKTVKDLLANISESDLDEVVQWKKI